MASEKLFKTFDDTLIKNLDLKCKRQYYYLLDGEKLFLEENKIDPLSVQPNFKLDDPSRVWNEKRKTQSLFLNIEVSMSSIVHLFYSDLKVCDPQTILGFGLEWKSRDSKVKYCKKIGEINNSLDNFEVKVEDIEICNGNSDVDFRWFIYVCRPGKSDKKSEEKYANTEGLVLAKELWWSVIVSGNGSVFPIDEYSKTGEPLWNIRTSFTDWAEDDFSLDNVAITFNPAHPLYELVNYGGSEFNEDIFKEVISSAVASLVFQILAQVLFSVINPTIFLISGVSIKQP